MPQYDPLRLEQWQCIERQLHSELNDAREVYERAKSQFDEARNLPNSQGVAQAENTALSNATKDYSDALAQYSEAVNRFSNYVLRGKLPSG